MVGKHEKILLANRSIILHGTTMLLMFFDEYNYTCACMNS